MIGDAFFRRVSGLNLDLSPADDGNWEFRIELRDGRRYRGKTPGPLDEAIERALGRCAAVAEDGK